MPRDDNDAPAFHCSFWDSSRCHDATPAGRGLSYWTPALCWEIFGRLCLVLLVDFNFRMLRWIIILSLRLAGSGLCWKIFGFWCNLLGGRGVRTLHSAICMFFFKWRVATDGLFPVLALTRGGICLKSMSELNYQHLTRSCSQYHKSRQVSFSESSHRSCICRYT